MILTFLRKLGILSVCIVFLVLTPAYLSPPTLAQTAADAFEEQIAVVIVKGDTLQDIKAAKKLIEDAGGQILVFLPPNVLRIKIRPDDALQIADNPLIDQLTFESTVEPKPELTVESQAALMLSNRIAIEKVDKKQSPISAPESSEPFMDDVRIHPDRLKSEAEREAIQKAYQEHWQQNKNQIMQAMLGKQGLRYEPLEEETEPSPTPMRLQAPDTPILNAPDPDYGKPVYYDTSLYMSGEIAVGIFFEPWDFDWTSSEIDDVLAQITLALEHFAEDNPNADITFTIINEAGENPPSDVYQYVNNLRSSYGTDWAYAVHALNGYGGAYAYYFGPDLYIFSADLRDGYAVRHESMHIFGAMDQYWPAEYDVLPTDTWGYLEAVNANSQQPGDGYFGGYGEGQPDIMISSWGIDNPITVFSRQQIGWSDHDVDGILDVRDTYAYTEYTTSFSSPVNNPVVVSGGAYEMPLPCERENLSIIYTMYEDTTLNQVAQVEYRLNGLTWIEVSARDGYYNERQEEFDIHLPDLPNGTYILDTRAKNSVGNIQRVPRSISFTVTGSSVTNVAPFAHFTITPPETRVGHTLILDPGESSDLNESIANLQVQWDVNNDGTPDTGWLPANQPYSTYYASSGNKTIKMSLRDSSGAITTIQKQVHIASGNLPPIADFTARPESLQGQSGEVGFDLDASATFDPEDGQAIEIRWQANGGEWTSWLDLSTHPSGTLTLTMPEISFVIRVTLEVRDQDGAVSRTHRDVHTISYNHPPTLEFNASISGNQLTITPTVINDPDYYLAWDNYLKIRFDFEGDGIWDTDFTDVTPAQGTMTFTLDEPVSPDQVVGQLRDRYRALAYYPYDPDDQQEDPVVNHPPVFDPIPSYTATPGQLLSFTVQASDPDGDSLILTANIGGSPVGSVGATFTDNGNNTGTLSWTPTAAHLNQEFVFTFTATDPEGASDSEIASVSVIDTREPIQWEHLVGVNASGNSLTKSASSGWGNGGARATRIITGDGGAEFTVTETNTNRMFGLAYEDRDSNFTYFSHAIYLTDTGTFYVYESGYYSNSLGTYAPGDVFTIQRNNGEINYIRNYSEYFISSVPSAGSLLVDTALNEQGATITNAMIFGELEDADVPGAVTDLSAQPGDGSVTLSWTEPETHSLPILQYHIEYGLVASGQFDYLQNDDSNPGAVVAGLVNGEEHQFRIYATNTIGDSVLSNVVTATPTSGIVPEPPDAITDLAASSGNGEVTLSWTAPADNGSPITGYRIIYGTVASGTFDNSVNDSDLVPGFTVTGLTNGTGYQFRVMAANAVGESSPSNIATAIPDEPSTAEDVIWIDLIGVSANGNSIYKTTVNGWGNGGAASSREFMGDGKVEFTAQNTQYYRICGLSTKNTNADILSIEYGIYLQGNLIRVYEKGIDRGSFGNWQDNDVFGVERIGSTIRYLRNDVPFYVSTLPMNRPLQVDAAIYDTSASILNATLTGDLRDVTDDPTPEAIVDLSAVGGNGQVLLAWTAPSDNGSPILSYLVEYGTVSSGLFDNSVTDDATPGIIVGNLVNGVTYQFRVLAENMNGYSDDSNIATATPQLITAPDPITDLAAQSGDTEVILAWSEPDDNGSPVLEYRIYYRPTGQVSYDQVISGAGAPGYTLTGLFNGIEYEIYVTSVNGVGESPDSNHEFVTPAGVPEGITDLAAQAGDTEITLTWSAPADNGSPIVDYVIYYRPEGQANFDQVIKNSPEPGYTLTGLNNGTEYEVYATARNNVGESTTESNHVFATPANIPNAITDLVAQSGNTEITLTWSAPAGNGSPIVDYVIYYRPEGQYSFDQVIKNDPVAGYTLTGLINGMEYEIYVTARNSMGESPESNHVFATPISVPAAITDLVAQAGDTEVILSWSLPADNGSAIIDHVIYYRAEGQGNFSSIVKDSPVTGYTLTGLTNGTQYEIYVTARNNVGEGADSNHVFATPQVEASVPDPIADLAAQAGDTLVNLTWSAPADNGSAIVGYVIYYRPEGQYSYSNVVKDSPETGYTLIGLANGTEYEIYVTARNGIGESAESNHVFATPQVEASVPDPIADLAAQAGDTLVNLTWSAPADNGSAIIDYVIYYRPEGQYSYSNVVKDNPVPGYALSGLTNGMQYEIYVTARNGIGESAHSNHVLATPQAAVDVPDPIADLAAQAGDTQVNLTWSVPADNGSAIISHVIYYRPEGQAGFTNVVKNSPDSGYTLTGLSNDTEYEIYVTARNSIGESAHSNHVFVTPIATAEVPNAVDDLAAQAGDAQAVLTWTVPADNGSAIVDYVVYYRPVGQADFMSVVKNGPDSGYTLTGLTNGTQYDIYITARNGVGESDPSNIVTVTPAAFTKNPIQWTNLIGVDDHGGSNSIVKTAATGWGNGGASSTASILGDGGFEITVRSINTHRMCGFSTEDIDANYRSINYALYLRQGGALWIFEQGAQRLTNATYAVDDVLSIVREGQQIVYKKNGQVLYQSGVLSQGPLFVDTALYHNGATISDGMLFNGPVNISVPDRIDDLLADNGDGQIDLTWSAPADNGSSIIDYVIYYRPAGQASFARAIKNSPETGYTLTGLTNGTQYEIYVTARNAIGESPDSNHVFATPQGAADVPDPITDLAAQVSEALVTLTWTAPADNGSPILDYVIYYRAADQNDFVSVVKDGPETGYTLNGLIYGMEYEIYVKARNAIGEASEDSNHVFATPAHVPIAINDLSAHPGDAQVALAWTVPAGTVINDYVIYYRSAGQASFASVVKNSPDSGYTLSGLTNGTEYEIYITARNAIGESLDSNHVFATPIATANVPDPITDLTAQAGDTLVALTWTAPADNGSPILDYVIYYRVLNQVTYNHVIKDSPESGYTLTGLTNGTQYEIYVTARNGVGESDPSNIVTAIPLSSSKNPIQWTNLIGVDDHGGSNSIVKTAATGWSNGGASSTASISGDGGFEITVLANNTHRMCGLTTSDIDANYRTIDYALYLRQGGALWVYERGVQRFTNATYAINDILSIVREGQQILYKKNGQVVYQSTVASQGPLFVDTALYHTGATISNGVIFQGQPIILTPDSIDDLSAEAGDGQIDLTWSAPADNGSAITEYLIELTSVEGVVTIHDDAQPGHALTGLTNGVSYTIVVKAVNLYGSAQASNSVTAIPQSQEPPPMVPDAITDLAAEAGNARVALNWSAPNDNGSAIILYRIEYGTVTSGAFDASVTVDAAVTGTTVSDLTNDIEYQFRTFAINEAGESEPSNVVQAIPLLITPPPTEPDPVTDLAAQAEDGQVVLSWSAPLDNGSPIIGYRIEYGLMKQLSFDQVLNDDELPGTTVIGLSNGEAYQFRVIAINVIGESEPSNVVMAVPHTGIKEDVFWTNLIGTEVEDNILRKIAVDGWSNGGATSANSFADDGGFEMVVAETDTHRMCGLSNIGTGTEENAYYGSIQHAFSLRTEGRLYIYDGNAMRGQFGTYATGDILTIERVGTEISYKINGDPLFTSPVASSGPMIVDASLYSTGATIFNAKIFQGPSLGEPPAAITDLESVSGDGEISLTWSAPADNGSPITEYLIGLVSDEGVATIHDDAQPGHTLTGLTNGVTYTIVVQAVNEYGSAQPSNIVTATPQSGTPQPDRPGRITDLHAQAGDGQVSLSWGEPDDNGSPINNYRVSYEPPDGPLQEILTQSTDTQYTVTGLTNGIQYQFFVQAHNAIGWGDVLNEDKVTATPQASITAPGVPRNLTAVSGDAQVELNWDAPLNDGGAEITRYIIQYTILDYGENQVHTVPDPENPDDAALTYRTISLENDLIYRVWVIAENSVELQSLQSNFVYANPHTQEPVEPGPVTDLNGEPGDGQVTLYWTHLAGEMPRVIQYQIEYGTVNSGAFDQLMIVDAPVEYSPANAVIVTATVEPLDNGIMYHFRVRAFNQDQILGQPSATVEITPLAQFMAPSEPLNFTAQSGDGQATVSWDPPQFNGGSPLMKYIVQYSILDHGEDRIYTVPDPENPDDALATTRTIILTNGLTYRMWVIAENEAGFQSEPSNFDYANPRAEEPPASVPDSVRNIDAQAGDRQVTLVWPEPADNGAPIDKYKITYWIYPDGSHSELEGERTGTTITDLTNGTEYVFSIQAHNEVGWSEVSEEDWIRATPTSPWPPVCTDECEPEARECSGNGYRTCGNFDSDSCLEWSEVTACPSGQTCLEGYCRPPICEPDCSGKECGDDGCSGSCGTCPAGYSCSADQVCTEDPIDECSLYVSPSGSGSSCTSSNPCPVSTALGVAAAGDMICLSDGYYGDLNVTGLHNSDYVTIKNLSGHQPGFRSIKVEDSSYMIFEGLRISPELALTYSAPCRLFSTMSDTSHITLQDSLLYLVADSRNWTENDWDNLEAPPYAIDVKGSHVTIKDNTLRNVTTGVAVFNTHAVIDGNTMENIGRGIVVTENDAVIQYNTIKNFYTKSTAIAFHRGTSTEPIYNAVIRGNLIISQESPSTQTVQGITCFADGMARNFIVENNVVMTQHWHGISLYGAKDSRIVNNIVFDPTLEYPVWIHLGNALALKCNGCSSGSPAENCVVRNNMAFTFALKGLNISADHNSDLDNYDLNTLFVDYGHANLHHAAGSPAIDAGSSQLAPTHDIEGNIRPQGAGVDIGAYEYGGIIQPTPTPRPTPTPTATPPPPQPTPTSTPMPSPTPPGPTCTNECSYNARECSSNSNGYRICGNYDDDICLEWSDVTACPTDQTCIGGYCRPPVCEPDCSGKECGPDVCGGSCGECQSGFMCTADQICEAICSDECDTGARECDGNGYRICGDYDDDACLEWSDVTACPTDQTCIGGYCRPPVCEPDCSGKECGPDGCGGSCGTCAQGYTCTADQICQADCVNECNQNARVCFDNGYRTCGNYDDDICLEWSDVTACLPYETCIDGYCQPPVCEPDCSGKECGADGCGGSCGTCAIGETCQSGQCQPVTSGYQLLVDHNAVWEFDSIPAYWLERAKELFRIHYGTTSHGSQITNGLLNYEEIAPSYSYAQITTFHQSNPLLPNPQNPPEVRTCRQGAHEYDYWSTATGLQSTRNFLDSGYYNMSAWSWCGQHTNTSLVQQYLDAINMLEQDYPNVTFFYMTGHSNGTTLPGNEMIREYCRTHHKILFDFEDIELYDMDGNYHPETSSANGHCPGCDQWCANNPSECINLLPQIETGNDGGCNHAHGLVCRKKAKAFWWMLARLAGWDGQP